MKDLQSLVKDKIASIGVAEASKLFGVSLGTVSNWSTGKSMPSLHAAQMVLDETGSQLEPPAPLQGSNFFVPNFPITMWEGKKVMILLPCYRAFNPHTHFTLFANYARYGADKLALGIKDRTVIHEARNESIHIGMMNPSIEEFLMFDDDMILPCESEAIFNGTYEMGVKPESARLNAISRLMSHDSKLGIIGALYYGRHKYGMPQCDWGFTGQPGTRANELRAEKYAGLHKQDWVGTGGIRIPRWAIETFKAAIDAGKFPGLEPLPGRWYGYFTPLKAGVGEDVSFCHRMKECGVQSYLDASLVLGHADGAMIWGPKNTRNKPV